MIAENDINFCEPLACGDDYPKPQFSPLPNVAGASNAKSRSVPLGTTTVLHSARARYAWASIAKAELTPQDTVLLPAYHCPAMVEPIVWAGCKIAFYRLRKDLSPEPDDLARLLPQAKAIVLVRFFGFEGHIQSLCEMAREQGCLVIEDLAHTAFAQTLHGDYGVTSLPKFYAVDYGSEIFIRAGHDETRLRTYIEKTQRNPLLWNSTRLLKQVQNRVQAVSAAGTGKLQGKFRYFCAEDMSRPFNRKASLQIMRSDHEDIVQKRRSNFLRLQNIFEQSGLGHGLYTDLDSNFIPYMYPFVLHDAEFFHSIRTAGVPLFRWEELAPTNCRVSQEYHKTLIQVPCHQDVTGADIDLIESTILTGARARVGGTI